MFINYLFLFVHGGVYLTLARTRCLPCIRLSISLCLTLRHGCRLVFKLLAMLKGRRHDFDIEVVKSVASVTHVKMITHVSQDNRDHVCRYVYLTFQSFLGSRSGLFRQFRSTQTQGFIDLQPSCLINTLS